VSKKTGTLVSVITSTILGVISPFPYSEITIKLAVSSCAFEGFPESDNTETSDILLKSNLDYCFLGEEKFTEAQARNQSLKALLDFGCTEVLIVDFDETKEPIVLSSKEFFRPADVTYLYGDSSLIRNELGWKPDYSFDDLVRVMVSHDILTIGN